MLGLQDAIAHLGHTLRFRVSDHAGHDDQTVPFSQPMVRIPHFLPFFSPIAVFELRLSLLSWQVPAFRGLGNYLLVNCGTGPIDVREHAHAGRTVEPFPFPATERGRCWAFSGKAGWLSSSNFLSQPPTAPLPSNI